MENAITPAGMAPSRGPIIGTASNNACNKRQHQGIGQTNKQIGGQRHAPDDQAKNALSRNIITNVALHG